jgi:hypothetical protein
MNVLQEIKLETGDYSESAELALRIERLERRLQNLEGWLQEVASDILDRFNIDPMNEECEKERIGS